MKPRGRTTNAFQTRSRIIRESFHLGRGQLLALLFAVVAGSATSAAAPLVLGDSLSVILGGSGTVDLSFSGLRYLLLVGVVALLVQFMNQILRKSFDRAFLDYWIPAACSKVNRVDQRILDSFEAGYLNRRISSEICSVPALFSVEAPGLIESAIVLLASLLMLVVLLPEVTLALVLAGLLLLPLGLLVARRARALSNEIIEKRSRLEGATGSLVVSQFELRSFGAEDRMCHHVEEKVRQATSTDLRNTVRQLLLVSILLLATIGGMTAFLLYAERSPGIVSAEVETVVSFLGYLALFAGRLGAVSTAVGRIQGSLANLDRMADLFDLPESTKAAGVPVIGQDGLRLDVAGLSAIVEDRDAFEDIGFSVKAGGIVAIRGSSGSGKTTLLKTLFGLHPRSGGSILVNGMPVDGLRDLGRIAVLMPQEIRLFPGTLEWNLELLSGTAPDFSRISRVLGDLKLGERLDVLLPDETGISEAGANLSGGERQRLALAAAILREPGILLLDEPTSQLDEETEQIILDTVRDLARRGTTVLIVTHNPGIDAIADSVVTLRTTA